MMVKFDVKRYDYSKLLQDFKFRKSVIKVAKDV